MPDEYKEAEQTEKAYQKQDAIFIGRKRVLGKKTKKGMRFTRNIGLGFKTPKEAIEGSYVDKKCPFTGSVSIRGRILKGLVISGQKVVGSRACEVRSVAERALLCWYCKSLS